MLFSLLESCARWTLENVLFKVNFDIQKVSGQYYPKEINASHMCKCSSCGSAGKKSACSEGDGFDPWVAKIPGEGKGYPLQYSSLENSMDSIVHGVTESQTRLSDSHFHSHG